MSNHEFDTSQITILHLSDLHFNEENISETKIILESLIEDLQKLKDDFGIIPNLVAISGDIATRGDQSDYNLATEWLNQLLEQIKILPSNVFIVPGNHDINRDELRKYSKLEFANEEDVTKFLNEERDDKKIVFKKLYNFFEFLNNFYGDQNPYNDQYYFSKELQFGQHKIGLVGLNSSWFSGETRYEEDIVVDRKGLIIGETQVRNAFQKIGKVDLCLTIMHHPFSWLADFDEGIIKRITTKNSQLILYGHTHVSSAVEMLEPDTRCIFLSAGASYIKDRDKRYSICKINLNDFSYEVFLRRYSEENRFWARDTLTYQEGEGIIQGRLIKELPKFKDARFREYPFREPDRDIEGFVGGHWKSLVFTESYEKDKILELRRTYFNKMDLNPPLHNIALQTVQYLLENKLIRSKRELENIIQNSPFIDTHIHIFEKEKILSYYDDEYFKKQSTEIIFSSKEEIIKLKERDFLIKKEREITQKIEERLKKHYKKKEQELEERKLEMELEYKQFKSTIDEYPEMDEEELPEFEKTIPQRREVWYEELGLRNSPFPSHIGLEEIEESLYDEIIVKTNIYHKFDYEIMKLPRSVQKKSYLIYGTMGSGKTTFFKYLQKTISILIPNTFTIFIPLEAQREFEKIRYDFYQKLYEQLEMKYFSITKSPSGVERNIINDGTISYLFKQIINFSTIENFIIFIDDLHKHPKYVREVFEFISGLQIFRSYLYENDINLSIFLSGDLSWISDADGVKAIGGSIDNREKIPEISIENAIEMINRRLKVFAKNPENPTTIRPEYIETIFKILKARFPIEITFRDVIEEVEKHWVNYEFESLQLNILLDFTTLSNMILDIETDHPRIKEKIDNIWNYTERDENIFNQFVEIIDSMYPTEGIYENDNEFNTNREYFGYLYRVGLITKQRRKEYFMWNLTKEIKRMFEKFEGKYGFRPSEYLSKLYQTEGIEKKYVTEESSRMNMIFKTGGNYGDNFLTYIHEALETYKKIFKNTTSIQELYEPQELYQFCKNSIVYIMKATLIVCEKKYIETDLLYDINEEFIDNWFENPDLTEFIDTIHRKEGLVA